eukprot:8603058-Lingulodinium_polyedra.AAC.1
MAAVPQRQTGVCLFADPEDSGGTVLHCLGSGQSKRLAGSWEVDYDESGFAFLVPEDESLSPVWWKDLGEGMSCIYKHTDDNLFLLKSGSTEPVWLKNMAGEFTTKYVKLNTGGSGDNDITVTVHKCNQAKHGCQLYWQLRDVQARA